MIDIIAIIIGLFVGWVGWKIIRNKKDILEKEKQRKKVEERKKVEQESIHRRKDQEAKERKRRRKQRENELIEKYGEEDGRMIFHGNISEEEYLREKELIETYGEEFGLSIFKGIPKIGMTKEMVEETISPKKYDYAIEELKIEKWYYRTVGFGFSHKVYFKNGKVIKYEEIEDGIWIDMTKEMLIAACGEPKDEKKNISREKTKLKWYYGGRETRQGTISYKYEVRLENDIVEGWSELE